MSRWQANLRPYLGYWVALWVLFILAYGGTNAIASAAGASFRLHAAWELSLPFVPAMIWPYLSLQFSFWLPLFLLDGAELRRFAISFALAIVVASAVFLVLPARVELERLAVVPGYERIFELLYLVDPPYNSFPSLHVALGTLTLAAAARNARYLRLRLALWLWLAAMVLSVVLVHQHHLADVAGGLGLGIWAYRRYRRATAEALSRPWA